MLTRVVFLVCAVVTTIATADPMPVKPKPTIVVTAKAIELSEPVYFEFGKGVIKEESYAVLDELAATLKANKKIGLVEIQGHTDERGSDTYNLATSQKRADAIHKYLVDKGISPKRLRAKGYGETKPLDPAHTEAAWAKNRRMAFVILQRGTA